MIPNNYNKMFNTMRYKNLREVLELLIQISLHFKKKLFQKVFNIIYFYKINIQNKFSK
jgi:formate hydrogenlyase subunit 4